MNAPTTERVPDGHRDGDAIRAAGAVLWRVAGEGPGVEVAVVHRPHHRDWSLPKGKVDPGETRAGTAVREIAEETGFHAVLGRHLASVHYAVGGNRKIVDYWAARAGDGTFAANSETDELRWLAPAEASGLLTYSSDRDVLDEFTATPAVLGPLLLVRHAKAGRRAEWAGPDDERPLEPEGREHADRLAALLALHGVTRLHAVPRTRCRQTLAPLAHRLGVEVIDEPGLCDEAVAADPGAARARLLEIAAGAGGPAAVCAQGDGIPALVRGLAAIAPTPPRSNRRLDAPPARKGSVWALSFSGPALVAADYVRDARF